MFSMMLLSVLILISLYFFGAPILKIIAQMRRAKGSYKIGDLASRIPRWIFEVLLQSKVIRDRPIPGLMHGLVFWGFMAFGLETLHHFSEGYGFHLLGTGSFYRSFSIFVAVFAYLVLIGIGGLFVRRFILRPETLGKFSPTSFLVSTFITILMVTFLFKFHGLVESGSFFGKINWWLHTLVILAFMILVPKSKHLHLVLSPATTFLKDIKIGRIRPLDFEKEEFGAEKFYDLDLHSILGAYTCVECGRCHDVCPATNTGKVLDPKYFTLDLRRGLSQNPEGKIVGDFVKSEAVWQCTTCGACTTICPVGVEHVVPMIELRRGLVANGEFPEPMNNLFRGLETSGNPWSYQASDADDFLRKVQAPTYENQDVLYWMGCMARYDAKYQKTAESFMDLLKASGSTWGVLKDETCTGDAARRSGNEFLYQQMAQSNIEKLNEAKPKRIVTTCPHCAFSLEEYKDLGLDSSIEITHHTEFLQEALEHGRLKRKDEYSKLTYHDACYLSRYQKPNGHEDPRKTLDLANIEVVETQRNRDNSFCCGAGGAMLFTEETQGKRINHERTDELLRTGASTISTSCPFCKMMISDGVTDRGKTEEVRVVDIADTLMPVTK